MTESSPNAKKVLIICYSFSGQTSKLLRNLQDALEHKGLTVVRERLEPVNQLKFPTSGFMACIRLMIITCLRWRVPIKDISLACKDDYDLIILAGPTWSYNPSGPILSLLDRYGAEIFSGKRVVPLISCRGYWRLHWFGLKSILQKCGAFVPNLIVFSHPNQEPWRTVGVFLKIAGKNPERSPFLGKLYKKFGHSTEQLQEAERLGGQIGDALLNNTPLEELNLRTPSALP